MTPDWDERYDRPDYLFGKEPNAFLAGEAHRLQPSSRVLCIADGEGRNGVWLACQGHEVVSMDSSAKGQEKAARLAREAGVSITLEHADIARWDWPEDAFDAVAAIFIQFAGPELRSRIFDGVKRTLRPGGFVLIEGYRPKQLEYGTGGPKVLENLYEAAMLESAFADFEILQLKEYDREVIEGPGHSGMSALVDLVARRPGRT